MGTYNTENETAFKHLLFPFNWYHVTPEIDNGSSLKHYHLSFNKNIKYIRHCVCIPPRKAIEREVTLKFSFALEKKFLIIRSIDRWNEHITYVQDLF